MAVVGNFCFFIFLRLTWKFLDFESERGCSICWPNNKMINLQASWQRQYTHNTADTVRAGPCRGKRHLHSAHRPRSCSHVQTAGASERGRRGEEQRRRVHDAGDRRRQRDRAARHPRRAAELRVPDQGGACCSKARTASASRRRELWASSWESCTTTSDWKGLPPIPHERCMMVGRLLATLEKHNI